MTTGAINLLARRYWLEVSTDNTSWTRVKGLNDFAPQVTPNKQDSSNYDSDGWAASEITMQTWVVTAKYNQQSTAGVRDPGQALIEACVSNFGDAARLYLRWYDTVITGDQAFNGRAIVEVQRSKTGVADLSENQVTFTGDGALTRVSNPYAPASVPTITSATPSGATTGDEVEIVGTGFTGTVATTGVKFGGVNSTGWIVVSDTTIVAKMPAGSAGSAPVVVTNATGASAAFAYTRT